MKKNKFEAENARLKNELLVAKNDVKILSRKLDKSECKKVELQAELKKNDVPKITLTKEQEQLLSNLLPGTDILNLLLD